MEMLVSLGCIRVGEGGRRGGGGGIKGWIMDGGMEEEEHPGT